MLFSCLFCMSSFAQKNIIKAGSMISGGYNTGLQYERSVSNNFSVIGQVGFAFIPNFLFESSTGIGFYVEGRYYFSKNKDLMEGWHAGIYTSYLNTKSSGGFFSYDQQNNINIGLVGGHQWVHTAHFTFDTLIGGGFGGDYVKFDGNGIEYRGFYPLVGLNIGYNF